MTAIRNVTASDIDVLYAIALVTGDGGKDASALHRDGRLIGHVYAAPYAVLCPEATFVAEDENGIAGYVAGAFDTSSFEDRLERDWWRALRARYADPQGDPASWNADQRYAHLIHHPPKASPLLVRRFPGHVHMNVLPRAQGRGLGAALLKRWLAAARLAGVPGVYLGTSLANVKAQGFWQNQGFVSLNDPGLPPKAYWFGMDL